MALSIRNPKAEKLAREIAAESGETITQAITLALEERLQRLRGRSTTTDLAEEILKIQPGMLKPGSVVITRGSC